jgi:hypothetical protein
MPARSAWPTQALVRFFNPRTDWWADHYKLDGVIIRPLTDNGKVTAQILGFNVAQAKAPSRRPDASPAVYV